MRSFETRALNYFPFKLYLFYPEIRCFRLLALQNCETYAELRNKGIELFPLYIIFILSWNQMFYFFLHRVFHVLCSWYIHPGGLWIALTYTEEKARVCLVLIPDMSTPGGLWIALCRDRTMLGMKTRVQDSLWRRGRPTPFMRLCLRSHFVYTLSLLSWIFIWILYEYLYPYLSLGRAHCDKSSTAPFYLFLFLFYDSVFFLNLVMVTPIFYGDPLDDFIFYFVFVFIDSLLSFLLFRW